jgi:hypothetical protein
MMKHLKKINEWVHLFEQQKEYLAIDNRGVEVTAKKGEKVVSKTPMDVDASEVLQYIKRDLKHVILSSCYDYSPSVEMIKNISNGVEQMIDSTSPVQSASIGRDTFLIVDPKKPRKDGNVIISAFETYKGNIKDYVGNRNMCYKFYGTLPNGESFRIYVGLLSPDYINENKKDISLIKDNPIGTYVCLSRQENKGDGQSYQNEYFNKVYYNMVMQKRDLRKFFVNGFKSLGSKFYNDLDNQKAEQENRNISGNNPKSPKDGSTKSEEA